jgi:hypothetical protein
MPMQGPLDEYRNGDNTVDWNKIFSAYRNVSFAGPQLTDLQKQDVELKQNQQGAGLVGAAKKTGMSALRVFGGIADMPRQAVVATGTGLWNSAIAPVLNAVTDGPDWQTDVNDDGQVTSDDNIVGQWSRVLKPFDDRNVIGMGRLAPFLQTEKDDSVLERGLKMTGALAGDLLTDPTFIAGSSKRALTTAQQVLFAGESAMELAPKLIGKEVSEEAAKDFVVGRLAKKNPDELARLANEYGVEATEEGFSIIGKSTDEMAKSLTDSLDSGSVSRLFAEEFSKETQAAMRRNNFSGPRRFMEAAFGDETGRAIYNQLPAVVRGAPEVGIPGTKLRKVVDGPYGGGQIIEKFGPVGHIIEEALIRKQRGLDRGIAALTFGERRAGGKAARMAAWQAGPALAMTAEQSFAEHAILAGTRAKLAANTAVGELKRMVDDAKVLDTAAGARAKSSNMEQQFIDAKSRFFNENDLNAVDTSKLTEVELDAFSSIQAKRNVEAQYVKYKEKYGDLFSSAGIIEGQRRVLTQQGADHLNEVEARIRAGKTTKFRGREAFQNEDGSWRSVEDINAEVGFKFFEDDPEIAHRLYVQRMQDALNNAAHTKTLMDAGIWWRVSKDSGTVFGVAGTAARRLERNATRAETASDAIRTDRIMTPAGLVKGEMGDAVDTAAAAVKSEREIYFELLNTANARFLAEKQRRVDQAKKILADESLSIDERLVAEREHVAALKEQRAVLAKDIKAARRDSGKMRAQELATAETELTRITSALDEADGQYGKSVESYENEIEKLTKERDRLRRRAKGKPDSPEAEAADAAQEQVVSMRNAHLNQRTIMEGRLSALRSQHSEAMLRRDMLADLEQPTTYENTINGMDDVLSSINAELVATGTAAERNAAGKIAKNEMRTEVQRLRDEQDAAKQVVREKNAEFRTGETQMESQPALDAATSRLEQLNEIVSTAKEVSTAKKTAIDAALSAQRSKDTRVLKKLMALIDDAPISEDLRSLVKANEENLNDEFDLVRLLGKRSAGNAKDIRTIMATIGSIKDEASRREAMHALIEKTIRLGAEEVGDSEKLLMEVIDKAFDKRLNLSFKDVGEANRLRAQIEERTNKVGVEAASEDKTVQRLEKKLKEIEDRADTELHERAAEESTRDYAARIEEQIKEEINSPEMKAVARDIKEYVKQFDKAEEGKAAAFGLQTSGEYLDSLVTEGIRRGDYQRIGNVKARGKTIPVPAYLEDMVTHSILAPGFARQYRITTNPVAMYPHAYTALQSLETIWKTSVTVMRGPSFVIRNVLGGMYNALLGGTESRDFALGLKYAKALNTAYKEAELAAFSEEGRNLLRPDNIGSFLEGYIEKNMSFEAMDGVSMYELHKKMTVRNIFGGSVMAEIQGSDPLTVRPGSYRKSYRDLAASINKSDMYAVERGLYPVGNAILNNPYTQMMSGWQENAERYLRSAQYFAGVRRGGGTEASHMYADMLVKATQFDYSDLSNFERKFLRHVAPFYTFTRNNLPLQLRSLVNRPGVPMAVLRMNYYANEYFGADPDSEVGRQVRENLAPWLSEAEAFPSMFGGDSPVIIGIGAPLIDINRFLPDQNDLTTWSGIKALPMNTLGGFTEESTSQLSPFVKLGVESLSGQNTFTGSPYRDRTVSPFMERLLFPFDKGIDKETGERKYSGFAEAQVKNFLPLIGQVSRLAPVGPFEDKNQQARWKTNVLGSGVGLSGLPVAPIATASPEQLSTWMYGNNKDANKEANKEFAEIGLDWSEITRAKNRYSWNQIADMVERGWFAAQYVEEGGGPSPEQIRQALEVAQRMRQLDEDR